jgi:hypothetical protein
MQEKAIAQRDAVRAWGAIARITANTSAALPQL